MMITVCIGENKKKVKRDRIGRIVSRTISSPRWGVFTPSFIKIEGNKKEREIILAPRGARIEEEVYRLMEEGKTIIILPSSPYFR